MFYMVKNKQDAKAKILIETKKDMVAKFNFDSINLNRKYPCFVHVYVSDLDFMCGDDDRFFVQAFFSPVTKEMKRIIIESLLK